MGATSACFRELWRIAGPVIALAATCTHAQHLQPGITVIKTPPDPADSTPPTGGPYDPEWYTLDGGGITFSSRGPYQLGSTLGQPHTGTSYGDGLELNGGLWGAGAPPVPFFPHLDPNPVPPQR